MDFYEILSLCNDLLYAAIAIELIVSLVRKDGMYSLFGTIGNVANGVVGKFLSIYVLSFYMGLYTLLHVEQWLGTRQPFTLVSFVLCLLVVDLFYYLFHRMHHTYEFFWMFHAAHHGDNKLNLSTAMRVSWVEQFYIFIFFIPVVLIGFSAVEVALAFLFLSVYQFFCHGQYLQLPRFFDYVLVTPNNHRVHHDQESRHQCSNYGGCFSVWDRLFGTYVSSIPSFTPGIKGYRQDNTLLIQLDPIVRYVRDRLARRKTPV